MTDTLDQIVTPSEQDVRLAQVTRQKLGRLNDADTLTLQLPSHESHAESVELPRPVAGLLLRILAAMAEGNAVTLVLIHAELTTQEAASLLGVSRPFLIKQMEENKLRYRKVGTHRRVRFADLMEYKKAIDEDRAQALAELAEQAQELKKGY